MRDSALVLLAGPRRVDVPLDPSAPDHADRLSSIAADLAPELGLRHDDALVQVRTGVTDLHGAGLRLVYAAGDATLAVALRKLTAPDFVDDLFVDGAIDAMLTEAAERRPYADVRRIELPCGNAIASLIFGRFDLPPEETGADGSLIVLTFRVEFLIPPPDWDGIVVLDISTTDEAAWPEVSQEAVRIARSLRFLDDGEPARDGEHLLRL